MNRMQEYEMLMQELESTPEQLETTAERALNRETALQRKRRAVRRFALSAAACFAA